MSDDIETLRKFIAGVCTDKGRREARPNALSALERLEKELDVAGAVNVAERRDWKAENERRLTAEAERDSLRAKLEKAAEAIKLLLATPEIAECDPRDKDEETHVAERKGRAILSELSADAPAQPPQIGDEAVEAALDAWYPGEDWRAIITDHDKARAEMRAAILVALEVERGK